jgi:NADPH2:quinone reductase
VLVHAAAGGVGLILCQWAKSLGATVIGTVGSEEKAALAKANGADHTILYRQTDFVPAVKQLTAGEGVNAVFDGVGKDSFLKSLECMAAFGTIVSFGQASGRVEPFDIVALRDKALYATRCSLAIHVTQRADLLESAKDLFAAVQGGAVKIAVRRRYALKDAVQAHRELEARATDGSSVFIP